MTSRGKQHCIASHLLHFPFRFCSFLLLAFTVHVIYILVVVHNTGQTIMNLENESDPQRFRNNDTVQSGFNRLSLYTMKAEVHTKQTKRHWLSAVTQNDPPLFSERTKINTSTQFYIDIHNCSKDKVIVLRGVEGTIRGFTNKRHFTGKFSVCYFQIIVPEDLYILAYSRVLEISDVGCQRATKFTASAEFGFATLSSPVLGRWGCDSHEERSKSPLLLAPGNVLNVKVHVVALARPQSFWLYFRSTHVNLRESFKVVHHSHSGGYITLHGFEENLDFCWGLRISYTLQLLPAHVLMLSFPYFDIDTKTIFSASCTTVFLELSVTKDGRQTHFWRKCKSQQIEADIFNTSVIFKFRSQNPMARRGFKSLFSFHPSSEVPQKLPSGRFNCSSHYETFHHHLDCNLRVECQYREDETGKCPFSSARCKGSAQLQVIFFLFFLSFLFFFFVFFSFKKDLIIRLHLRYEWWL